MSEKKYLALLLAAAMLSAQAKAADETAARAEAVALDLAETHHCFTCHAIDRKITGPAWKDVAAKYRGEAGAEDKLVKKVSNGGTGVWGNEMAMPAFAPHVKEADIRTLVRYVLSLK